jgi:dihydropteroate synthase
MLPTIGKLNVPYCMMHMKGTPETMKDLIQYQDLLKDILFYFSERLAVARQCGINDIIIDPGFGFAKNITQNFELLRNLEALKIMDLPILIGVSRKSMIYKTLQTNPEYALNGTTALHMVALQNGANILRVHDVKEAVECVKLFELIK